jgi:glycosyltransferase involved in cell wall biosynthesis
MDPLILDLSRLISRAARPVPTGIDRVEMAYALHLIAARRERLVFAAMTDVGRFGLLPKARAEAFVMAMHQRWRGDSGKADLKRRAVALQTAAALAGEGGLHRRLRTMGGTPRYFLVSHHHLDRPASIKRLKDMGARFVCLVHDLIPIELPEYARAGQPEKHARRMRTVARYADAVIVNSASTGEALRPILDEVGRHPPVVAAHIGFEPPQMGAGAPVADPYFVYVATIEPRKNHLLLLKLWRGLAAELRDRAPRLHLIGQRGWNTGGIVDMLDRSAAIKGFVIEHNALSDRQVETLLAGARALLFPAFAEGFGLPLAEALARGVPAVASDLPALREVGGPAPEYLDPLDGPAWRRAVLDYADPAHPRRKAQLKRIARWRAPSWEAHFETVAPLFDAALPPVPEQEKTPRR